MQCSTCGSAAIRQEVRHVVEIGPVRVGGSVHALVCERGHAVVPVEEERAHERRALAAVLRRTELDGTRHLPSVVARARKGLGVTQEELGVLLGRTGETICRWESERGRPMPRAEQLALVALLDGADRGLDLRTVISRARARAILRIRQGGLDIDL